MSSYPPHMSQSKEVKGLVLIVEDEIEIAEILAAYLSKSGLRVVRAADGRRALEMHQAMKPDLVLLDVQMPLLDGWQVMTEIRSRSSTPVIMLTAFDKEIDKLIGLRIGADDYIVKPFNPDEVVARTHAVLRRSMAGNGREYQQTIHVAPLLIDLESHEAKVQLKSGWHLLALTLTEFRLLAHLARTPSRVMTRAELLAACLPEGDALERTVDSHISKLRRKLEDCGVVGIPFGVRGVGYKLRGNE